jgi:hypothetical protein
MNKKQGDLEQPVQIDPGLTVRAKREWIYRRNLPILENPSTAAQMPPDVRVLLANLMAAKQKGNEAKQHCQETIGVIA